MRGMARTAPSSSRLATAQACSCLTAGDWSWATDRPDCPVRDGGCENLQGARPTPGGRASDVLADELRAKILSGELLLGTLLPTERDLAEQSGIGRSSVREALKTLEIQGLIVTRPG